MPADKMLPRNRTARAAGIRAAGNPVVTDPESGVGNCFPGLEADLRNLDRRFFPYLAVDFVDDGSVPLASVDLDRARAELPPGVLLTALESLTGPVSGWRITTVQGDFAGYGPRTFTVADLGGNLSQPPDAWTAVRLLRPGSVVTLTAVAGNRTVTLRAPRASYLDDDGAFAEMFAPGELTQSLCSPWTHDFRDCGCFYWASNHPDIVQPALPAGTDPDDPAFSGRAVWLRADRLAAPPPPDVRHQGELDHNEINGRWQELDVVLDGREQRGAYHPDTVAGIPLPPDALVPTLRYAAGVELAVMLEYLAAAFSLDTGVADADVRDDARAAQYEVLRVATSEMRHLRAVNGLLFAEHERSGDPGPFAPALGVATVIPEPAGAPGRPVAFRPLTPDVLAYFVQVEAPSRTVDALYGRILATYRAAGRETQAATVAQVMAEGADHYTTFRTVAEWLNRHPGTPYLRTLRVLAAGDPTLATLQQRYETVLGHLHDGYRLGIPAGGPAVRQAIAAMLDPGGVRATCEALADAGDLPVFAVPADPRFAPVGPV